MRLQVRIEYNTLYDPNDAIAFEADEIIVATGAQPADAGFQRALPMHDQLPGIEKRNVFSAEDVMRKDARLGKKVILLDETANWKGTGTAIQMAEQGHEVTVITAWPTVMAEMARTNADIYARQQMRKLGVTLLPETVIHLWQGDGAVIQSSGGDKKVVNADSLVIAETPVADTTVSDGLNKAEIDHTSIGDSIASRTAVMAIYEGRKLAQSI